MTGGQAYQVVKEGRNHMGSIEKYETKHGIRYRVRYRDPNHRSREKAGFTTKRAAADFDASITVSSLSGEYIDPHSAKARIDELGTKWLDSRSHLKPSSKKPLETSWRVHVLPVWGTRRVGEILHSDITAWISDLTDRRSATVVIRAYSVLNGVLETARRDRRIAANPAAGVALPKKIRKRHTYLSHTEVEALADASGVHGTLVRVLANTGLRWGEVTALKSANVNPMRRRITVAENALEVAGVIEVGTPKSHKIREVPIPPFLMDELAAACAGKGPDDLVFPGRAGGYMRRVRVSEGSRSWFKNALDEAGLKPMTIHDLRHTAASLAVSSGANVKAVQRMLGHKSAAMTLDIYADLFDDDLDALAARLDAARSRELVGDLWGQTA
jgi:integrase